MRVEGRICSEGESLRLDLGTWIIVRGAEVLKSDLRGWLIGNPDPLIGVRSSILDRLATMCLRRLR